MKNQLWDSFNFTETTALFKQLKKDTLPKRDNSDNDSEGLNSFKIFDNEQNFTELQPSIASTPTPNIESKGEKKEDKVIIPLPDEEIEEIEEIETGVSYNFLEQALSRMCKRGGFKGAIIADHDGLPVAVFNSPFNDELLATYSIILGESLDKATSFFDQPDANNISLDINMVDKIVLRKFMINESIYFVMIILSQAIDEKAEIEVLISQIHKYYLG
jgi:predicted regulator of Ras-like GTPase activity (Roadblock/LC7/MglB family)